VRWSPAATGLLARGVLVSPAQQTRLQGAAGRVLLRSRRGCSAHVEAGRGTGLVQQGVGCWSNRRCR
jgi:hypothetical protein